MAHAPFTVRATQMTRFGGRPDEPLRSALTDRPRPLATSSTGQKTFSDLAATVYGSEGWGVESLRVRPGQRPSRSCRGCHHRRRWLSYIMALAGTTVVETVSAGGSQVLAGSGCCSKPGGCDDQKHATMGRGLPRWSRSDGRMSWCPDGHGCLAMRGACLGDRRLVLFGTLLNRTSQGSMNETGKPSGERASVSKPVPAAA
jgi:hypothetical protein